MTGFPNDLKVAARSLVRAKGMSATVVLTLALGIGANAAIFTLVRGVLLRPLVNRDESHLVYIRQSASAEGIENTTFSVPEIKDLQDRLKSISKFGDFSTIGFTLIGLGAPREVRAGVVSGSYFDVVGLRPVLGRLLGARDDGPNAAGAAVLTYRFWSTVLKSDPAVLNKSIRLSERQATIVGVLEPSVPYPADTEIIANVVTSPHHLSATMVTGRVHRMTELFGRLAPGVNLDQARAELGTVYASMVKEHPEAEATGKPLAEYLSEKIWCGSGMERDAEWMIDDVGHEQGGCCIAVTLRDYGRFGQFILDGARINGKAIVAEHWLLDATRTQVSTGERTGYGYQWWTRDDGTFEARGIYGQTLHIDRSRRLVIVINSAIEQPTDRASAQARQEFIAQMEEELDREARASTARPGTPSHGRSQ